MSATLTLHGRQELQRMEPQVSRVSTGGRAARFSESVRHRGRVRAPMAEEHEHYSHRSVGVELGNLDSRASLEFDDPAEALAMGEDLIVAARWAMERT